MKKLYDKYILPRLINWAMDEKRLAPLRAQLLAQASGTVVEIGFGAGANLAHYPATVQKLIAVEPSEPLLKLALKKLPVFKAEFTPLVASAVKLPLKSQSVDCVVSTFTLCSVSDTMSVLREAKRVLRPGGKLLFVEHGLAPEKNVQRWQKRLTPIQRRLAGGCCLDRNILGLLADACFDVPTVKRFYVEGLPKIFGFVSLGQAE